MKMIFALIGAKEPDQLEPIIHEVFPGDYLKVGDGQWLVAAEGTTQSVCERLGIYRESGEEPPRKLSLIVLAVSSYFGRQSPQIWEWIKVKWGGA